MPLAGGDQFAGFTVQRLLGAGGMGEVYLVQHPRLPRLEALKILPANATSDDSYRERFNREADLAASLWHPHRRRAHDRGEHEGQLWISMDLVEGTDAAKLLDGQPNGLPVGDVVEIVSAIADALDFAHQRGLLHRDVKPANILLTTAVAGQRRILLADFGIARHTEDISGLTATNATIGTVAYSAPEQLLAHPISGSADQYALAATAFHLLTGAPVYPDSNPAVVIGKHLTGPPPPLSERRPELRALDPVLARGLSKNPADRFATCLDFANALKAAASGVPASIPHAPPTTPTPAPVTMPGPTNFAPGPPVAYPTNVAPVLHAPRRRAVLMPIFLAVLLIGAVAFAVIVTKERNRPVGGPPAWQPYVDAGGKFAVAVTTINYNTPEVDIQRITDTTTGSYRDDFTKTLPVLLSAVREVKSVSTGTLTGAGLESLDGDTAKVLASVSVKTATANDPDPAAKTQRLRLTVVRQGNEYKISGMEGVS